MAGKPSPLGEHFLWQTYMIEDLVGVMRHALNREHVEGIDTSFSKQSFQAHRLVDLKGRDFCVASMAGG